MKDWIKRWLNIEPPSKADFEDLASASITALGNAQQAHISDLRILLDKAADREAQLAAMVKMVMEERFYRPVVTGKTPENKQTPAVPLEHLSDVHAFDEAEDTKQVAEQDEAAKELTELILEQNREGRHKVAV